MTEFPAEIKFKYSWRKYQQRVLVELDEHLNDKHLHVIAPPGSGKTVLGLEVAIRLNKPTLVLAPTIAIRNQWIQRFCELFLQTDSLPTWISRDIRNPKFLTVSTYQGLHAACNNWTSDEIDDEEEQNNNKSSTFSQSEFNAIVKGLKSQNIKTIVVDEAHHLKNDWWQTLTKIKEALDPVVVGLTATPPYDVTPAEWQRYTELNGPVDTEISVPELVVEGDLCPHQDYVYLTSPTENENQKIVEFRQNIKKLYLEISKDEYLIQALKQHPIWKNPLDELDWIYTNLSYYSACLIYLHSNGIEIPEVHIEVIGDKKFKVPDINYQWVEILLEFYLFKDDQNFNDFEEHRRIIENRLRRYGVIERRKINLSHNKRVTKFLTSSISKLEGIKEIVDFEYGQLKNDLRLVILSDFIRKEYFTKDVENNLELNKIGIIPIFEKLRRTNTDNKKIAVLTGSIVLIPTDAYSAFKEKAAKYGIHQINSNPVPYDHSYIQIKQTDKIKHDIVHIVTQIFQEGEIEVLIGTKSLLGEGWDAPAINTLILASFVGSFVLSNQMRGRAIRTQKDNRFKTGNIWHLACIDSTLHSGGDDIEMLRRRFRSFVGISFDQEPGIESGIGRLKLPTRIHQKEQMLNVNNRMFSYAAKRRDLEKKWQSALETGTMLVEEIKIPFAEEKDYKTVKSLYLNKTIANLFATLGSGLIAFGIESLFNLGQALKGIKSIKQLMFFLSIVGIIGIAIFGRYTLKTFRLYFKYRDISKDIQKIGEALLTSLINAKVINSESTKLKVKTSHDRFGAVFCHLEGGTTFDKSTFINALQEIIAPVNNPRYVIIRKSRFMLFVKQKDYHSVPESIGRNKKLAEFFRDQWTRLVGNCDLIFTRSIQGRKLLLKSRVKSLASQFEEKVIHINKWK